MGLTQIIVLVFLTTFYFNADLIGQTESIVANNNDWEAFPIINYDTDVGFGYGAKGFFYNFFQHGESFDLIAYNSTKGERWYRIVYSVPDIQRRQGKKYDLAFDLIIDYDKWINYKYYFNSPSSANNNEGSKNFETYIREPIELSGWISKAISKEFIVEFGIQYKSISSYNFENNSKLRFLFPNSVQHISILSNIRFDTRTNFINPHKGIFIQLSNQYAKDLLKTKQNYFRIGLTFQLYTPAVLANFIYASRINIQLQSSTSYQNQLALGGNNSVRGLSQDRYLANSLILFNQELRFPIYWRFNGILGLDIGNGKTTPGWIVNPVLGLRFNMDNFIVRADLGFGNETTGFYFNFGHLF